MSLLTDSLLPQDPVPVVALAAAILVPYYCLYATKKERIAGIPHLPSFVPFLGRGPSYYASICQSSLKWRKQYGDIYTMIVFGKLYCKIHKPPDIEGLVRLPEKRASLLEAYQDLAGRALPQPDPSLPQQHPQVHALVDPLQQSGTPLIAHSVRPHNLTQWVPDIEGVLEDRFRALPPAGTVDLFDWCRDLISAVTVRMMLGSKLTQDPNLLQEFVDLFFEADPEAGFGTPLGALATVGEVAVRGERKIYGKVRDLLFPLIDEEIDACTKGRKQDEQDSSVLASIVSSWYHRQLKGNQEDLLLARTRIANDLFSFTFAAFSNSFSMAAWVLYHYLRDTHGLQGILRNELVEIPENQKKHTYPQLEAAVLEIGRLYTPGDIHRKLREDWTLPSNPQIVVPKGTVVLISGLTTMRDPTRFDSPHQIDWNRDFKSAGALFMPFGAGAHPCVGKKFALLEIALLTAKVIREMDLELLETPTSSHAQENSGFVDEIIQGMPGHPPLDLTQPGFIWRPSVPITVKYQKKERP